jgi:hypothetical protein
MMANDKVHRWRQVAAHLAVVRVVLQLSGKTVRVQRPERLLTGCDADTSQGDYDTPLRSVRRFDFFSFNHE